jgi:N-acetyl-anhydromuramyl-L-alanine amidase AmpD
MKIKPMLGDFELDGIEYIESSESRALVEHRVPGLAGDYFQDAGTVPNTIWIEGSKSGDEARDNFLTGIRRIFNEGQPTSFVADINTATEIENVLIEDLEVWEIGGRGARFRYVLKLRKYIKPPEPPSTAALDAGILSDALGAIDTFNLLDAFVTIPNLGDPSEPVSGVFDQVRSRQLDQVAGEQNAVIDQEIVNRSAPPPASSPVGGEPRRLDPADPRIDQAIGPALQQLLDNPETAAVAARLVDSLDNETLSGIFADDSDEAAQLAAAHGREVSQLIPAPLDGVLVLDPASPFEAPPTMFLRNGVLEDPARLNTALDQVGEALGFFERGELMPCDETASIAVPGLVPSSVCRVASSEESVEGPTGETSDLSSQTPEEEPEVIDPSAPDLQIDPNDPRIDVGAKFALQRMLKVPEMAADAARLIRGIHSETLAGIFGDDLGVSAQIAEEHGTVRWELVPKGEDAALVLDAALPLEAPPDVIFRGDTPDIRNTPTRIDPALQKASQTFALFQQGQLAPCESSASSIPVSNLVPPSFCQVQGSDLLVVVTEEGVDSNLPGSPVAEALVQVEGPLPSDQIITQLTGDTGEATFAELAAGTYVVSASKQGFGDTSVEVVHPSDRVQQQESFVPVSTSAPLFGSPGPILLQLKQSKLFTFETKNRLFDEMVPDVGISITPKGGVDAFSTRTKGDGKVEVGISDSELEVLIEARDRLSGPVGPSVGQAGGQGPDRIWRALEFEMTIRNERVTNISNVRGGSVTTDGETVTIKLQPVWMRSPNFSSRPSGEAATINLIVVHGTGTTNIESAINTFMNSGEISAHYVLDLDGQLVKMVHEDDQSHHAGESHWDLNDSINRNSIGIEIVHENDNATKLYTEAQYNALLDRPGQTGLLNRIRDEHTNIPVEEIVGHSDIATISPPLVTARRLGRKATDPGVNFDWSRLVLAGLGPNVKRGVSASSMYGGLFDTVPNAHLQVGDNDAEHRYGNVVRTSFSGIIAELHEDLRAIGYFAPTGGAYSNVTAFTVMMFQDHVFSVGSPHPDGANGTPSFRRGEVDKITAFRIKEIRP